MIIISLFMSSWTEENIYPHDWSKPQRYKNYLAVTSIGSHGKIIRDFLEKSRDHDLYFNVDSVQVGNILLASCWDWYKHRQYKRYWLVIEKTKDQMTLEGFSTYRKAYKAWEEYLKQTKEVEQETK